MFESIFILSWFQRKTIIFSGYPIRGWQLFSLKTLKIFLIFLQFYHYWYNVSLIVILVGNLEPFKIHIYLRLFGHIITMDSHSKFVWGLYNYMVRHCPWRDFYLSIYLSIYLSTSPGAKTEVSMLSFSLSFTIFFLADFQQECHFFIILVSNIDCGFDFCLLHA